MTRVVWLVVFLSGNTYAHNSHAGSKDVSGKNTQFLESQIRFPSLLPLVEYYGGATFGGVPDLRLGLFLYEQWQLFSHGKASALLSLNFGEDNQTKPLESGGEIPRKREPVKKFTFDDGTIIYYSEEARIMFVFGDEEGGIFFVVRASDTSPI